MPTSIDERIHENGTLISVCDFEVPTIAALHQEVLKTECASRNATSIELLKNRFLHHPAVDTRNRESYTQQNSWIGVFSLLFTVPKPATFSTNSPTPPNRLPQTSNHKTFNANQFIELDANINSFRTDVVSEAKDKELPLISPLVATKIPIIDAAPILSLFECPPSLNVAIVSPDESNDTQTSTSNSPPYTPERNEETVSTISQTHAISPSNNKKPQHLIDVVQEFNSSFAQASASTTKSILFAVKCIHRITEHNDDGAPPSSIDSLATRTTKKGHPQDSSINKTTYTTYTHPADFDSNLDSDFSISSLSAVVRPTFPGFAFALPLMPSKLLPPTPPQCILDDKESFPSSSKSAKSPSEVLVLMNIPFQTLLPELPPLPTSHNETWIIIKAALCHSPCLHPGKKHGLKGLLGQGSNGVVVSTEAGLAVKIIPKPSLGITNVLPEEIEVLFDFKDLVPTQFVIKPVDAWEDMANFYVVTDLVGFWTPSVTKASLRFGQSSHLPSIQILLLEGSNDLDSFIQELIRDVRFGGKVPTSVAKVFMRQAAATVGEMHLEGYSHGDVKAANFLVRRQLEPTAFQALGPLEAVESLESSNLVVCDMGSTHLLENVSQRYGSAFSSAPEYLLGAPASSVTLYDGTVVSKDGSNADVWALGIVLHQLLFSGAYPPVTCRIAEGRADYEDLVFLGGPTGSLSPTRNTTGIDTDALELLEKMLTIDAAKRITMAEIRTSLANVKKYFNDGKNGSISASRTKTSWTANIAPMRGAHLQYKVIFALALDKKNRPLVEALNSEFATVDINIDDYANELDEYLSKLAGLLKGTKNFGGYYARIDGLIKSTASNLSYRSGRILSSVEAKDFILRVIHRGPIVGNDALTSLTIEERTTLSALLDTANIRCY
ncbi:UNVERIFIED_CONTAM: hypothetical protein HDU68_010927 [Siphonaria sp. JEL0065]|nr:hypothetical protein HDU68_010927 [Siphonaria sp. JEL0065]